jgi:hypothetical protein
MRERDRLEDPGVDGRIILRWICRKWNVEVWNGIICSERPRFVYYAVCGVADKAREYDTSTNPCLDREGRVFYF